MFHKACATAVAALLAMSLAAAPATADVADRIAGQLAELAHPLGDHADLDVLLEAIDGRRTVLLGEASHGTEEYYTWRSAITRRLIEERGFRAVLVEADWAAIAAVNRYVRHAEGAPASASAALEALDRWPQWMWVNAPFRDLVEWLRAFNRDRPEHDRVGLYGMDIYGAGASAKQAPDYLEGLDADAAKAMRGAIACYAPYADDPEAYHRALQRGRGSCALGLETMFAGLRDHRERYREQDPLAYFHAEQNAAVVMRSEKHVRTMAEQDTTSWNARARNFNETLERVRAHHARLAGGDANGSAGPGMVAWAHNTHIGDAQAVQGPPGQENLGGNTRRALGADNVFIVGFGSHRGTLFAGRSWAGPRETMTLPAAASHSLEDILWRTGRGDALYLMAAVRTIPELTQQYVGHRAAGVVYHPEREVPGNYVPSRWPDRYDAFLFIEETRALSLIEAQDP